MSTFESCYDALVKICGKPTWEAQRQATWESKKGNLVLTGEIGTRTSRVFVSCETADRKANAQWEVSTPEQARAAAYKAYAFTAGD